MTTRSLMFIPIPLGVFGLGTTELIIILVAILIIFGPSNLPKLADAMGKAIRNFKKSSAGDDEDEQPEVQVRYVERPVEKPVEKPVEQPTEQPAEQPDN